MDRSGTTPTALSISVNAGPLAVRRRVRSRSKNTASAMTRRVSHHLTRLRPSGGDARRPTPLEPRTHRMPVPLDEYPLHQAPLSMRHVATSDRNAYDRCYFNAHDRTGEIFLVTGLGVYSNLGVIDGYATVRRGGRQLSVRPADALTDDRLANGVAPYRVEVMEPLHVIRRVCDGDDHGVGFDLTW